MIGRREGAAVAALLVALAISGCSADVTPGPVDDSGSSSLPSSEPTTDGGGHAQFAIITDYGNCDQGEADVAEMVAAWHPQIIATAGDNTQGASDCAPFTQSVGDYYSSFLTGPDGPILFPVPGNHDYEDDGAGEAAYLDYFAYLWSLSDNPLWYEVSTGNVNLFMLDSEASAEQLTEQREWLESSLSAARSESSASWNIVVFHRPPFTSGPHEPNVAMRPEAGWDYAGWGADLVVSGHQHVYEELKVGGLPYVVAGVGTGGLPRPCPAERVDGSVVCVEGTGALLVTATDRTLTLDYRKPDSAMGTSLRTLEISRDS